MKNQSQAKGHRSTTAKSGQSTATSTRPPTRYSRTDRFVRQELAKLSPSARLLQDAANDSVQIRVEMPPEAREAIDAAAQKRGMTRDQFAEAALRKWLSEDGATGVSEAEMFFIAEALRHCKFKLDAAGTADFLHGFLELMRPYHPARAGLERILSAHEDRDERIESLQIGQYLAAAA